MSAANASVAPSPSPQDETRANEPSMEEILASIRRIIADDQSLPSHRREREERRRHDTDEPAPASAVALAADGLPGVLLLTDKPKATPLYKSLSTRFEGQLKFGQAASSSADVARLFGVDSFPALVVLHLDGTHARYEGALACCGSYMSAFATQKVSKDSPA